MGEREVIFKTALVSRLLLIVIQYVSNLIIPDHEADAYRYPKSAQSGILDNIVTHFFGGFVRWDAQYFMHISRYGYTYEHTLAFFPLSPYLVRSFVLAFRLINPDSLTLLIFISINTFCFIQSALCLYELSLLIVNKKLAFASSILFCYNPASVFFSAPYTESLFCYLTFKSMLNCVLLYKKYCDIHHLQVRDVVYIIPICLSTVTRSNGVLNIGFLVYILMCLYFRKAKNQQLLYACKFVTLTALLSGFCLLPFVLFQIYSFQIFCKDFETDLPASVLSHEDLETFVLPGTFSKHNQSWCFKKLPLAYSYVQSHYWKVGFLQYYELKQLPNFLLAFPVVFIVLRGAFRFFKQFPKKISKVFELDLVRPTSKDKKSKFNCVMIVFVIHATALTLFSVLNIHVQVTTRMLCSASPVLYWFSSFYVSDLSKENLFKKLFSRECCKTECFILGYFLSYYVVGTVMFCNSLPWT